MTMINTTEPGTTIEVTVLTGTGTIRLQAWFQNDTDDTFDRLFHVRLTPEQAEDVASALGYSAHAAVLDKAGVPHD